MKCGMQISRRAGDTLVVRGEPYELDGVSALVEKGMNIHRAGNTMEIYGVPFRISGLSARAVRYMMTK